MDRFPVDPNKVIDAAADLSSTAKELLGPYITLPPLGEDPAVQAAVKRLYVAFSHYPRPWRMHYCDCCVTDAEVEPLLATPLRELSADDLGRYPSKALSTWGDDRHYRYFLPRIVELSVDDLWLYPGIWGVCGTLAYAGWRSWPPDEQRAIEQLVHALLALPDDERGCNPYGISCERRDLAALLANQPV
jgi:hypothetical protein